MCLEFFSLKPLDLMHISLSFGGKKKRRKKKRPFPKMSWPLVSKMV